MMDAPRSEAAKTRANRASALLLAGLAAMFFALVILKQLWER